MTAVNDGVLKQDYVNKVLHNFGIVETNMSEGDDIMTEYEGMREAIGVDIGKIYNKFQYGEQVDGEVALEDFGWCPRVWRGEQDQLSMDSLHTIHDKQERINANQSV